MISSSGSPVSPNVSYAIVASPLRDGVDPDREAPALYFLTQGLVGPILIGLYRPDQALALIDAQLDRVFR